VTVLVYLTASPIFSIWASSITFIARFIRTLAPHRRAVDQDKTPFTVLFFLPWRFILYFSSCYLLEKKKLLFGSDQPSFFDNMNLPATTERPSRPLSPQCMGALASHRRSLALP
jgi:hypothetical protein